MVKKSLSTVGGERGDHICTQLKVYTRFQTSSMECLFDLTSFPKPISFVILRGSRAK